MTAEKLIEDFLKERDIAMWELKDESGNWTGRTFPNAQDLEAGMDYVQKRPGKTIGKNAGPAMDYRLVAKR